MQVAIQNVDLDELLAEPREALDIEIKNWLDLSTNEHKAVIAKEIIALANHGSGYLVIGFDELPDGTFTPATPRPTNLDGWSQDAIQSIVAKYCDPAIQCRVVHKSAGASEDRFPIISVPGGHKVPIRPKSGSPDGKTLVPHRIYIRRPGPNSEEPKTTEEWNQFLERLVQNRQSELVDAMRSIMSGVIPGATQQTPSVVDQLLDFETKAIKRWGIKVAKLRDDAPPRFPHGFYDAGFAIDGEFRVQGLSDLQRTIATSVRNHSGWPPFVTLTRAPFAPKAVDGAVEFWRGPEPDGSFDLPAHHDFWRASPRGQLFTRRGYQEDGGLYDMTPGKFFDITTPTWRLGEAIMEAAYVANALDASDANLVCHCRWFGLSGRQLISRGNPNRRLFDDTYVSEQSTFEATQTVALSALPLSLPEVVHTILTPLYELFGFFVLPKRLVEEELASLLKNRF
jgi:hypothetical protein